MSKYPNTKIISPAKINLGLNVLYKRPDNYHEIQSIFIRIDFGDEISFEPIAEKKIELISKNELTGFRKDLYEEVSEHKNIQDNILYKAYQLAQKYDTEFPGLKIHLTKRIPPGGGLGGGSSNAACLLSYLFGNSSPKLIREIATKIGADVSFFLEDNSALVWGIGDKMKKISVSKGHGILAIPSFTINTKDSYLNIKKSLQKTHVYNQCIFEEKRVTDALIQGNWASLRDVVFNDLEDYAFQLFPQLLQVKNDFYQFGSAFSLMTGSGSCIFALVQSKNQIPTILDNMQSKYPDYNFVQFNF